MSDGKREKSHILHFTSHNCITTLMLAFILGFTSNKKYNYGFTIEE